MSEMLVRVDENDNQIGTEEKVKCHQIDHRVQHFMSAIIINRSRIKFSAIITDNTRWDHLVTV